MSFITLLGQALGVSTNGAGSRGSALPALGVSTTGTGSGGQGQVLGGQHYWDRLWGSTLLGQALGINITGTGSGGQHYWDRLWGVSTTGIGSGGQHYWGRLWGSALLG